MKQVIAALRTALAVATISVATAPASFAAETITLNGTVLSGVAANRRPISGAEITILQAHDDSRRIVAVSRSNQAGKFRVTFVADDGGIFYAVARKGSHVVLMSVLGNAIPETLIINEMTTVASAYAFARLLHNDEIPAHPALPAAIAADMAANLVSAVSGQPSSVIRTPPNAYETNAWQELGTLSNILAGCVRNAPAACGKLFAFATPPGGQPPTTTLEAITNIARHPAQNVRKLFALGNAVQAFAPSLDAEHGPDASDKFMRLDAFTLAIKFNATGRVDAEGKELCPFGGPGNFVFDQAGYMWITNNVVQGTPNSATCMIVLKPNGQPADGENGTPSSPVTGGGVLGQGFGLGFDPSGTMWSGNFGWGNVFPTDKDGNPGGSVSRFTRDGKPLSPPTGYTSNVYRVQGTVSDRYGDIWLAGYDDSRIQILPRGNANSSYPYYHDSNRHPFDIRLDRDGAAWVSYSGSSTVSKFVMGDSRLSLKFTRPIGTGAQPKGVAVDSKGNAWIAAGGDNSVYAFDKDGNSLGRFVGAGVAGPWGVSTDADDIVWAANFGELRPESRKYSVAALCGATESKCPAGKKLGDLIGPPTGYTLPSGGAEVRLHNGKPLYFPLTRKSFQPLMRPTTAHPDAAGNLWVTNNWKPDFVNDLLLNPGGDGMIAFVGLAAPVWPVYYNAPPISPFGR